MCDEAWLTHLLPPTPCGGLRAAGEHASSPHRPQSAPGPTRPGHRGWRAHQEGANTPSLPFFPRPSRHVCWVLPACPGGTSWLPRVTRLCGQLSLLADLPCGRHLIKNATTEHTEDKPMVARGEGVQRGKVGEGTERSKLPVVGMQG